MGSAAGIFVCKCNVNECMRNM